MEFEIETPTLCWVNTGKKKLGWWPALTFRSLNSAVYSGLNLPPSSVLDTKNIEQKMNVCVHETVLINMLEVNAWTTLPASSKRLTKTFQDRNVSNEIEKRRRLSGERENSNHERVTFNKAVQHAMNINAHGFDKWMEIETSKFNVIAAADMAVGSLASEEKRDGPNDLSLVDGWAENYPIVLSLADGNLGSDIVDEGSVRWVPAFLKLYALVQERNKTTHGTHYGVHSKNYLEDTSADIPPISNLMKATSACRGHHSGVLYGADDLILSSSLNLNQQMVRDAMLRGSTCRNFNSVSHLSLGYIKDVNARTALDKALSFTENKQYESALEELEIVLNLCERDEEMISDIFHNIAVVHLRAENYDKTICEEALLLRTDNHGNDHPRVADSLILLGTVRIFHGEYKKALSCFFAALRIRKKEYGRHVLVCSVLKHIGCTYFLLGKLGEALAAFEDALQAERMLLYCGEESEVENTLHRVAASLTNIGHLYIKLFNLESAKVAFEERYMIQEVLLAPDDDTLKITRDILLEITKICPHFNKVGRDLNTSGLISLD